MRRKITDDDIITELVDRWNGYREASLANRFNHGDWLEADGVVVHVRPGQRRGLFFTILTRGITTSNEFLMPYFQLTTRGYARSWDEPLTRWHVTHAWYVER